MAQPLEIEIIRDLTRALNESIEMLGSLGRVALAVLDDLFKSPWIYVDAPLPDEVETSTVKAPTKTAKFPCPPTPANTAPGSSERLVNPVPTELEDSDKQKLSTQQQTVTGVNTNNEPPDDGSISGGSDPIQTAANNSPKEKDSFWEADTLRTQLHPTVPSAQHAPKYAPEYETLADIDSAKLFPKRDDNSADAGNKEKK